MPLWADTVDPDPLVIGEAENVLVRGLWVDPVGRVDLLPAPELADSHLLVAVVGALSAEDQVTPPGHLGLEYGDNLVALRALAEVKTDDLGAERGP